MKMFSISFGWVLAGLVFGAAFSGASAQNNSRGEGIAAPEERDENGPFPPLAEPTADDAGLPGMGGLPLGALERLLSMPPEKLGELQLVLERIQMMDDAQRESMLDRIRKFRALKPERQRAVVRRIRDIPPETRRAIASHWARMTPEQAAELRERLREMTPEERSEYRRQLAERLTGQGAHSDQSQPASEPGKAEEEPTEADAPSRMR